MRFATKTNPGVQSERGSRSSPLRWLHRLMLISTEKPHAGGERTTSSPAPIQTSVHQFSVRNAACGPDLRRRKVGSSNHVLALSSLGLRSEFATSPRIMEIETSIRRIYGGTFGLPRRYLSNTFHFAVTRSPYGFYSLCAART